MVIIINHTWKFALDNCALHKIATTNIWLSNLLLIYLATFLVVVLLELNVIIDIMFNLLTILFIIAIIIDFPLMLTQLDCKRVNRMAEITKLKEIII